MKLTIACQNGKYDSQMRIICKRDGLPCAFQYFKSCKGWWTLTDGAKDCVIRKEWRDNDGKA